MIVPLKDAVGTYGHKRPKIKSEWIPKMQQVFKEMKLLLATDAITSYLDHNKPFHIYIQMLQIIKWEHALCNNIMTNGDQLHIIAKSLIELKRITQ